MMIRACGSRCPSGPFIGYRCCSEKDHTDDREFPKVDAEWSTPGRTPTVSHLPQAMNPLRSGGTIKTMERTNSTAPFGWTVVARGGDPENVHVYKRDRPATGLAADLSPFTHPTKKLATSAGEAGHFAYAKMHRIYVTSGMSEALHIECRDALKKAYPHLTFDAETIEGVSGVRFHTTKYELDSPVMMELREFCRRFRTTKENG